MPLLTPLQYVTNRESYDYRDPSASFHIIQTGTLPYAGTFEGIFPRAVPATDPHGINLRKFEGICKSVFDDAWTASQAGQLTTHHVSNVKSVALAIVHWKMASQGGRAARNEANVNAQWHLNTHIELLNAYANRSLRDFEIGGVRIPTASAFLRFLDPDQFGIVDRRVIVKTQLAGITTMSLRPNDNYINDVNQNIVKYSTEYIPFLRAEAAALAGVTFQDFGPTGLPFQSHFRPCDIEMALF